MNIINKTLQHLIFLLIFTFFFIILSCSTTNYSSKQSSLQLPYSTLSILQGSTTETSTTFRIIYPKTIQIKANVEDKQHHKYKIKRTKTFSRKFSAFAVAHFLVEGLSLNKTYSLIITSNSAWHDKRYFKTLNLSGDNLKILIESCTFDKFAKAGKKLWHFAFSKKPDLIFMNGDNIYADVYKFAHKEIIPANPRKLWSKYISHALSLQIYKEKNLIPVYATWDDHDYGVNNGTKDFPYKKESKEMFNIFNIRPENASYQHGPGISSVLRLKHNTFLLLDDRFFRDKKQKNGYHFGLRQRQWMLKNLNKDNLNWLMSGDQFFGGYHKFDSFEGNHPKQFQLFLQELKRSKKKVVFISGDRHLIEIMDIPKNILNYQSREYTISGMHTTMYPGSLKKSPNKHRLTGFDGLFNFAIFNIKKESNLIKLNFNGYALENNNPKLKIKNTFTISLTNSNYLN